MIMSSSAAMIRTWIMRIGLVGVLGVLLVQCEAKKDGEDQVSEPVMPAPRAVTSDERASLVRLIGSRTGKDATEEVEFLAAGPFRFAGRKDFLYFDRTDIGSMAFEVSAYGADGGFLDPDEIGADRLLARIDQVLAERELQASGKKFSAFQDEFAGAGQPAQMASDFDIRSASRLVARTAAYERDEDGIPVFGSELLIGLLPDGSIGRLRLHWPTIESDNLAEARKLQEMVRVGSWPVPEELRRDDIEIIEVAAGVGHSALASPGYREAPVVRVLFRKSGDDPRYPTQTTGFRYYLASGEEISLSAFPTLPGTTLELKRASNEAEGAECPPIPGQHPRSLSIQPCVEDAD